MAIAIEEQTKMTENFEKLKDLTEKLIVSEKKRCENESRYLSIFNSSPDPIFVFEYETLNIVDANKAACEVYGYSYEEIITKKILDMSAFPMFSYENIKQRIALINHTQHISKKGNVIHVSIHSSKFIMDNIEYIVSSIRDITWRLETQKELDLKIKLYENLVNDSDILMCRFTADSKLTFCNKRLAELFNEKPKNLLGVNFVEFLHDAHIVMDRIRALTPDNPVNAEYHIKTITYKGITKVLRAKNRCFFDNNGKPIEYQMVATEVSQ